MNSQNKKIAFIATNGFEKSELFEPLEALKKKGMEVDIISTKLGGIKSWEGDNWGKSIEVDKVIEDVNESEYDALVLPGGVANPDSLRINENILNFIRAFFESGKPVAAICHAPWLLISAGVVENREVTSFASIKDDLVNAGAKWVDKSVVVDSGLVTSRKPADLPDFINKVIEEILEGKHEKQVVEA